MIDSKRITVISVFLMLIAVISAMMVWLYSLNYEADAEIYSNGVKVIYTEDDEYNASALKQATEIKGQNSKIAVKGGGVYINGDTVNITSGGYYRISGNIGNIVVRSPDSRPVGLILDNAYIESSSEPPVYVYRASKCILSSAENSDNYIVDKRKKYSNQSTTAAVYSVSDISVNGKGSIHIEADYQDGIYSSKYIKVISGDLDITAKDEGLNANAVFICDGAIAISSEGDSIKADEKQGKGIVAVSNDANIVIHSEKDGIYSTGDIYIKNGELDIFTGMGAESSQKQASKNLMPPGTPPEMMQSRNTDEADAVPSMKGLKADNNIYIEDGSLLFDSDDDAIHSSNIIKINGGIIAIATGDDGIRADESLLIDSGKITVTDCYEGLESRYIEINGGDISVIAIDDGINVSGSDMFGMMPPMDGGAGESPPKPPGEGNLDGQQPAGQGDEANPANSNNGMPPEPPRMEIADDETTEMSFVMNDGNIYIEALGDGVDINGSCEMNGGRIVSFAKTDGPDLAFDFDGVFRMNGGVFMGAGNANMIEEPSEKSKSNCVMAYTPMTYRNGGSIEIEDSAGNIVESFETDGSFCWIGWYGDAVKSGETYTVLIDGEAIGSATVNSVNTIIASENANRNAPPGMNGGPRGPGGGQPPPPPGGGGPGGEQPPQPPGGNGPGGPGGGQPPQQPGVTGNSPDKDSATMQNTVKDRNVGDSQILFIKGISAEMNILIMSCCAVILVIVCILAIKAIKRRF